MTENFKIFNADAVLEFECFLKHICAVHELAWEFVTTIIAPQIASEEGDIKSLSAKLNLVSSVIGDYEDLLEEFVNQFLLTDVATATNRIIISKEDISQLIWMYGHMIVSEEHIADYIKKHVIELQKAKTDQERSITQEKIIRLSNFLHTARLIRKKLMSGFLQKLEEVQSEQTEK